MSGKEPATGNGSANAELLALAREAERLMQDATRERLIEAVRILALQLAHYQALAPGRDTETSDIAHMSYAEQATWIADSLENIAASLTVSDDGGRHLQH